MKVLTVAEVVIFIICGTLFSLQVKEQLARFFRGERAFTFQTSIKEDLRFPALAFCPKEGFKSKVMEVQLGLGNRFFWTDLRYGIVWEGHHVFGDTKIPQSKAEFDRWWTESTLGVDDILRELEFNHGFEEKKTFIYPNNTRQYQSFIDIKLLPNLLSGNCLLVNVKENVKNLSDYVSIKLKYLEKGYSVYIFNDGLQDIALRLEYWIDDIKTFDIFDQEALGLGISVSYEELHPHEYDSQCTPNIDFVDYMNCLEFWAIRNLKANNGSCQICYLPPFQDWLSSFPACTSMTQAQCSYVNLYSSFIQPHGTNCLAPCKSVQNSIVYRKVANDVRYTQHPSFFMYMNRLEVNHRKEIKLFDFNTIVAAVGGSMGLFLGFSCLDFGRQLLRRTEYLDWRRFFLKLTRHRNAKVKEPASKECLDTL